MPGTPRSLLHLAPTLLDILGLTAPPEFEGRSMLTDSHEGTDADPAVVEVVEGCTNPLRPRDRIGPRLLAVRDASYKLVFHFGGRREELFDLQSDPGERAPLPPDTARSERRRLLQIAKDHLARSSQTAQSPLRLSAKVRELRRRLEKDRTEESSASVPALVGD
jgi:arylsulfatase A-like enzyme